MKIKRVLLTAGLSLSLGLGVFAAVAASNRNFVQAKADVTTPWYVVGKFAGVEKWSHSTGYEMTNTSGSTWVYENLSFAAGDEFKVCDAADANWQGGWSFNNGASSADIKTKFSAANDGANIVCGTAGIYTVTFTQSDWHIKIEEGSLPSHTVTKYAVYDGVLNETAIGTDAVADGETYAVPGGITKTGYHFNGWYTEAACTNAYVAKAVNADFAIYGKYTSLVADSYVYYVTGSKEATTNYIYSYGGDEQFGAWPGTKITTVANVQEVHGVMSFQGTEQLIYKIPYAKTANDSHIILNVGSNSSQTSNMLLVEHSAYWWSSDAEYHNDDAGAALELILAVEAKRNAVVGVSGFADYSICGVSAADAATLYNRYYALSDDVKAYIDVSTTYTYKGTSTSEQENVLYAQIMQQLKAIALAGGQTVSGASRTLGVAQILTNNYVWVIVLASIITISSAGLYFFIRKRKMSK